MARVRSSMLVTLESEARRVVRRWESVEGRPVADMRVERVCRREVVEASILLARTEGEMGGPLVISDLARAGVVVARALLALVTRLLGSLGWQD